MLLSGAYGLVIAGVPIGVYVRWSSAALLTDPLAWTFARRTGPVDAPRDPATTEPAAASLYLSFGLLLVAGVAPGPRGGRVTAACCRGTPRDGAGLAMEPRRRPSRFPRAAR